MEDDWLFVSWYEHDCDWISKYCDEHHLISGWVRKSHILTELPEGERDDDVV